MMWWAVVILALSSGMMYLYQLFGNPTDYSPSQRSKLLLKDSTEPLKILLIVEPTPFGYTSGYSNRFKEMLDNIRGFGDEVYILTPDDSSNPPTEYMGYPITTLSGYRLIFYDHVMLSIDLEGKIEKAIQQFQPDVIHVSTPGTIFFPAIYYARKHRFGRPLSPCRPHTSWNSSRIPLLMSYHTHLPLYAKIYVPVPGSVALAEFLLSTFLNMADLALVTSPQLKQQVSELMKRYLPEDFDQIREVGVHRVGVWQKGINTEVILPTSSHSNGLLEIFSVLSQ